MTAIRGEHRANGAGLRPGGPRMTMVAMACAAFTAAIGLVALIGWAWQMPLLTRVYATGSAMQPVTAVCALLGATVVGLIARQPHRVGPASLVALLLLGGATQTLAEHWTGWMSGVDGWLFPGAVGRQAGYYAHPGRMAEPTALAFALVAVALLSIRWRGRGARLALSVCATTVLLLVTVALLSHLFGAGPLDGVLGFTQMSVPTACALGGLAVGTMALRPGGSWVALLTGDSVGAAAARWLLPVVVLVPVGVTALALRGTEAGLYPATFRTAFTTAVTVILLAALALWGTRQLDGLVAERRIAEALRESEATLRAFFDTDGLFASIIERREGTYRYLAANAALAHLFGRNGLAGVALDDVGSAQANRDLVDRLGRVEASGRPDRMEMAYEASAGPRWFMITVSPIAASPRATPRFATAAIDITERKRAEARQTLLLDELNHRVKNTLAVVQSLAQQSFRGDQATPRARAAFEARLAAVAAAHHQLVRQDWRSASLAVLVEDVAGPGCGAERDRITAKGPDVLLPPPIAVSLALAFHELCTNAVKYGALANAEGRVTIAWHVEEGSRLRIVWTERGGPPVVAPTSRGFGSRLIERALSADLGGPVALHFAPEGLCCTITTEIPPLAD